MRELSSIQMLEELLAESAAAPVLLFKHSTRCPVSAAALRRAEEWLAARGDAAPAAGLIKVVENRPLSQEAAARLQVTHQSPQAIVLRNGAALWNASHGGITAQALETAFPKAG